MNTEQQHEKSGCPDYLQHNADSCPCLIAEQYSDDQYDTEAIEIDARHGNFSEDRIEDYRHENIVRASLVNGQFSQARKQCESYGLNYEIERYKFNNE